MTTTRSMTATPLPRSPQTDSFSTAKKLKYFPQFTLCIAVGYTSFDSYTFEHFFHVRENEGKLLVNESSGKQTDRKKKGMTKE